MARDKDHGDDEVKEWFVANRPKYPTFHKTISAAAKKFGFTYSALRKITFGLLPSRGGPQYRKDKGRVGMSRQSFLSAYDTDTKTREAIRRALTGLTADDIIPDAEFRLRKCEVGTNNWRMVSEEPEFRKYQFIIGGKVFWALPETVKWALNKTHRAKGL